MAQQIAVVTTDGGSFRIHAQGCKAVAAEVRKFKSNGAAKYEADNLTEIATQVWGDVAASNAEEDTPEYRTVALELLKADDQVHDCLADFPETDAAAEPAYATIASNTRNKHLIKPGGEGKTVCGKAIKDIVRAGEVAKRTECSLCVKAREQKAPFVRAEQVDWSGEKPRVARVTVPGLGIDVPVKEKAAQPAESPRRRAAAASAAKQAAKEAEAEPETKVDAKEAAETKAPAKKAVAKKSEQPLVAPKVAKGVKVTAQAVLEWLPGAFERGAITKSQKGSYVTVVNRLFAFAPDGMATDVYTEGLLDQLDAAFRAAEKKSEITYKVYKGDLRKCLFEFYALYAADPKGWESKYPVKSK